MVRSEIPSWMRVRTLVSKAKSCATRQPVFPCQSSHKTSCNRILERFLRTNDPRERLSVLKFPFRAIKRVFATFHAKAGFYLSISSNTASRLFLPPEAGRKPYALDVIAAA